MVVGGALPFDDEDDSLGSQLGADAKGKRLSLAGANNQKPPNIIYLMTVLSAMGGFLFGYDTGIVSGAMVFVRKYFELDDFWHQLVVSITILGAWMLSIGAGGLSESYGRKTTILFASLVFTLGSVILGVAWSKWVLLFGRLIVGVAIGLASTVVPMYIAEVAPSNIRGSLVTLNNTFITFGQLSAAVTAGAFSYDAESGWRWMLALAAVPSIVQFVGFMFMPESPRWLIRQDRNDEALAALRKIRGDHNPYVLREFDKIRENQLELRAQEQRRKDQKRFMYVAIMRKTATRRALTVGCLIMAAQQLAGINTVMYYTATIITMSGIRSESIAVWLAVPTAAVYVVFSILGCFIADKCNRRVLTLGSLLGSIIGLLVLGTGFQVSTNNVAQVKTFNLSTSNGACGYKRDCFSCIQDERCVFCYNPNPPHEGSTCLVKTNDRQCVQDFGGAPAATKSPHFTGYSGLGNQNPEAEPALQAVDTICPSMSGDVFNLTTWLVLSGLIIYLASFAPGMGPMPWTINSEIYPMWARSFCYSIATSVNWLFNMIISITFISLTGWLTPHGTFYMYSVVSALCWLALYLMLPETRGLSLEDVNQLFAKGSSSAGLGAGSRGGSTRKSQRGSAAGHADDNDDDDTIDEGAETTASEGHSSVDANTTSGRNLRNLHDQTSGLVTTKLQTGGHRHSIVVCHDNLAFAADNMAPILGTQLAGKPHQQLQHRKPSAHSPASVELERSNHHSSDNGSLKHQHQQQHIQHTKPTSLASSRQAADHSPVAGSPLTSNTEVAAESQTLTQTQHHPEQNSPDQRHHRL